MVIWIRAVLLYYDIVPFPSLFLFVDLQRPETLDFLLCVSCLHPLTLPLPTPFRPDFRLLNLRWG